MKRTFILFLSILLSLRTYQTELIKFSFHSILAKLIKGSLTFDLNLWDSLNEEISLIDVKNYNILRPILAVYNTGNIVDDEKYGKGVEKFLMEVQDNFGKIEIYYKKMLNYHLDHSTLNSKQSKERSEKIYSFSKEMIQVENLESPTTIIDKTVNLFSNGLTNLTDRNIKPNEYSKTCSDFENQISLQSALYDVLTVFVVAEIKVYLTVSMALINLNHVFKDSKQYDVIKACHVTMIQAVKNYMTELSRDVWGCQPDSLEDDTHVKLNNVFQEHLLSEKNLPGYKNNNKCDFDCLKDVEKNLRKCPSKFDPNNCRLITNLKHKPKICLSKANTGRRYEFIDVTHYKVIEDPDPADEAAARILKNINIIGKVAAVWIDFKKIFKTVVEGRVLERIGKVRPICKNPMVDVLYADDGCCQIFSCTCDDDVDFEKTKILSERWFYGGPVYADFSDNYVITGMRFRKTETGVVHIQIQQGKLIEGGNVDASTVHWKVTPNDDLNKRNNHLKLTLEEKYIELMDIDLTNNDILVGIEIKKRIDEKKPLRILVMSKKFDFLSGKLLGTLEMQESEKPSESIVSNEPYNVPVTNAYLSFGTSKLSLDFGQTTVPFLDIQDVTTTRPYPMAGVGLYYRYSSEHELAGFLAIKLKTYDFSQDLP